MAGFENFLEFLKKTEGLWLFLSTLLWGVYVYFTIRTFREIAKQTELESRAFLIVSCVPSDDPVLDSNAASFVGIRRSHRAESRWLGDAGHRRKPPEAASALDAKWARILNANVSKAVSSPQRLTLSFLNRGASDIVRWSIDVEVYVSPSEFLRTTAQTGEERQSWKLESRARADIIAPGEEKMLVVGVYGNFPQCEYRWKINFEDMRGVKSSHFSGDALFAATNALANPSVQNNDLGVIQRLMTKDTP